MRHGAGGYDWCVESDSTRRVLVIGAGGHARVCIEALRDMAETEVVGAISADGFGMEGLGAPMLGTQEDLKSVTQRQSVNAYCVAIGDNSTRKRVSTMLTESGYRLTLVVSGYAMPSPTAVLSPGAQLLPGAVVNAGTEISTGAIINSNATVEHDCHIGEYAHVGPGAAIGGAVRVEHTAFLGLGSRVLPGIQVGAGAIIGAGAVVIDDVPAGLTVVGSPARPINRRKV